MVVHDETLDRGPGPPGPRRRPAAAVLETHRHPDARRRPRGGRTGGRSSTWSSRASRTGPSSRCWPPARGAGPARHRGRRRSTPATLERVGRPGAGWPRWLNSQTLDADVVDDRGRAGLSRDLRSGCEAIDETTMALARAAGLEVAAWTVRRRATYDRLARPRRGRRLRRGRGARRLTAAHGARRRADRASRRRPILAIEARTDGAGHDRARGPRHRRRGDGRRLGVGLREAAGLDRVVVLERGLVGMGASSRAAGIVRAQGGTPATVALGRWTIDFYNGQPAAYGTDSGFRELGYLILAVTDDDERAGRERVAMQQANGSTCAGSTPARRRRPPAPSHRTGHRGGATSRPTGNRPATQRAGVLARDAGGRRGATRAHGFHRASARRLPRRVTRHRGRDRRGRHRDRARAADRRPSLRAVGRLAGLRIPAGAARHSVAVLEPHPAFAVERMPMVFDIGAGLYWRLEEGGLLFGWSDPDEQPGEARRIDWAFRAQARAARRVRAADPRSRPSPHLGATIDYTPDHLPILGPALDPDGSASTA